MKSSIYGFLFLPSVIVIAWVLSSCLKLFAADPTPTPTAAAAVVEYVGAGAEALAQTEIAFAKMSVEQGVVKSFGAYLADDAVELPDGSPPLRGKAAILEHLARLDRNKMELNWRPTHAEVAGAGDLGYTFGVWELRIRGQPKILATGNYATVWRKTAPAGGDARWLAVLDMGNQSSRGPD